MKRLWVRLSAVAGIVALLGGGGYYWMKSGTAANEKAAEGPAVAEKGGPDQLAPVTPLKDEFDPDSPASGSYAAASAGGGFGGAPPEPAQAAWRDDPSQPIIRQVSSDEKDEDFADANFRVGDAPPEPAAVHEDDASRAGDQPYEPAGAYGVSDAPPAYGASDYGAPGNGAPAYNASDYGAPGNGAPAYSASDYGTPGNGAPGNGAPPVAAAPAYPGTGGAPAAISADYGNGESGYGSTTPVVPPAASRQDFAQPVAAPNFADGEAVGAGATQPVAGNYDAPAVASSSPNGGTASAMPAARTYDSPAPAYDPTPVAAAAGAATALVAAIPGDRSLDGRQTPAISVEKMAPAEIQVGKPAAFKTLVRNTGQATAKSVVVTDRVPQGTQLVDATPRPSQAADGRLVWQFDSLSPGEEVLISMEVMPQVEGEIGSQALVTFQAQASVRTVCTKPQLLVEHSTDPKVLIGENVVFNIAISNPGSGDATGVVLEEDVPKGLSHAAGGELEFEVGTLRPGETRRLELVLKASEAGVASNKLRVRGDANLLAEHTAKVEVIAPKLLVGLTGPRRRYLDREVKYQVAFGNAGTAIARNIELATYLPKGLQFVSTTGKGQYDSRDHAVYWSLDQLAPGQEGAVDLIALPVATGDLKLQLEGTADLGLTAQHEHTTVVEAITELVFTVSDTQDPIEVGSETTYEVRIVNNGSKAATNVQVAALLPAELTPLSGEGTTRVAVQGQQVVMAPIDRMGPRDEAVYKIKVKGLRAGDHLIDVRLVSAEVPTPVTKQESTKVYADGL